MSDKRQGWKLLLCGLVMGSAITATGCQVDVGGQTLPSGWYQSDDLQYFNPGPEFKLYREAATMKAYSADDAAQPSR